MLHILLIPSQRFVAEDNPVGGIFQLDLALALQRSGLKVGIIAPVPRSLRGWKISELGRKRTWTHSEKYGIPVLRPDYYAWIPSRTPYLSKSFQVVVGNRLFERYVDRHGMPDVVHAHNVLFAGAVALSLKRKLRLPYILTEHSSAYISKALRRWQEPTVQVVLKNADRTLVVSNHLGHKMERQYGEFMHPWEKMPNVVNSDFTTAEMRDPKKAEGRSGFCFLNVAAMLPWKNQAALLRAFAASFEDRIDAHLRMGGDGPLRGKLVRLSRELGIRDRVTFLGSLSREKVLEELQSADAFVLSSDFETFGVVLIEALAMGKPVISTDCGGPQEIVHEGNGILVPVGDVDALARAMARMSGAKDQYSSRALRDACIEKYGEQVVAARHMALYKSVVGSKV